MYQVSVQTLHEPAWGLENRRKKHCLVLPRPWQQHTKKSSEKLETTRQRLYRSPAGCCLDPGAGDEELISLGQVSARLGRPGHRLQVAKVDKELFYRRVNGGTGWREGRISGLAWPPWEMEIVNTPHECCELAISKIAFTRSRVGSWSQILTAISLYQGQQQGWSPARLQTVTFGTRSKPQRRKYNRIQDRQ